MTGPNGNSVIDVSDLAVAFQRNSQRIPVVNGISSSFSVAKILRFWANSGSGKSVTLRALMGVLPPYATVRGRVVVGDRPIYDLPAWEQAKLRGPEIAMIYQEPAAAFDPVFTVGQQIVETILQHEPVTRGDAQKRALELLDMVAIPSARHRLRNFPHELSGGMRQRAMIALALACKPKVLLADEPTTALDVTVQMQVLFLIRELRVTLGMSVIFVTHDIGVAAEISDRIAVMYAGRFVETGSAHEVLLGGQHPYTEGLLSSTVRGGMRRTPLAAIGGLPPDPAQLPLGCAFSPRCSRVSQSCMATDPAETHISHRRTVRCLRVKGSA